MSQMSGAAGTRFAKPNNVAATGRAMLVLALAVVAGIVLLNGLDDSQTQQVATSSEAPAPESAAITPAETTPPTTAAPMSPAEVTVLVANGTSVQGAASRVASRLQPVGYQLVTPNNMTTPIDGSGVLYAEGFEAEARALATSLGIPGSSVEPMPLPAPVEDLQDANLVAVVGEDLAGEEAAAGDGSTAGEEDSSTSGAQTQSTTTTAPENSAINGPLGGAGSIN